MCRVQRVDIRIATGDVYSIDTLLRVEEWQCIEKRVACPARAFTPTCLQGVVTDQ